MPKRYTYACPIQFCFQIYSSGKKDESEKEEPPPGEAIIPTLPDVKMCAAKAIARSAKSGTYFFLLK